MLFGFCISVRLIFTLAFCCPHQSKWLLSAIVLKMMINSTHSLAHTIIYNYIRKLKVKKKGKGAAAHVVIGTKKFDHITPVLRQLHWLPVRQRITFKLTMITFKCLYSLAPLYLANVCTPVSSVVDIWQLRLANSWALVVPRTRTTISGGTFALACRVTWNSLPVDLRTSSLSRDTFAKKLKTHLFCCERSWSLL